ncbi:centrosomal protein of 290 kDa-like [Polypterus senegalus]|uniref:centrosomal protein of 290 kDa-like n=1 Tax=Polypterus senegalus TaxID=55291 RepID=UPI0019638918|nr:centrosomal protein of 290 kDa-like [Polypterus senegalus]
MVAGGRDICFLRNEIRQQEYVIKCKDKKLAELDKEINKEKKSIEILLLRAEEAEVENSKLKREVYRTEKENEDLRQDIIDYQMQIDAQRDNLLYKTEDDFDIRAELSKKNNEIYEYLDDIQNLTEANEKLDAQNHEMQKNLQESAQEMERITDKYNKIKVIVQKNDVVMDQLRKENEHLKLQLYEMTEQLHSKLDEDDTVMEVVKSKVEEWKKVFSAKDEEILKYQEMLTEITEKLKAAQLDCDKSSIMALQQELQKRDGQIKMLSNKLEQCTHDMEKNTLIIEELQKQLQTDAGDSLIACQNQIGQLQAKLQAEEQKLQEMVQIASQAESDAKEKDKELSETLAKMRAYEAGEYGLESAVAEINKYKNQVKLRDKEIESLIKEINNLDGKISDLLYENEDFRERLGLDIKQVDLTAFRRSKVVRQQQYRAENQVLLKEIERLEDERLELKKYIRLLAKEKGKRPSEKDLKFDDLLPAEKFMNSLKGHSKKMFLLSNSADLEEMVQKQTSGPYVRHHEDLREDRLELYESSCESEKMEENSQLEQGMREIMQAIKDAQKGSGKEVEIHIPVLERLLNAMNIKNSERTIHANMSLKAQVDQLTGRNEELRREIRDSRKETVHAINQMEKALEKAALLENEVKLMQQTRKNSIVFQTHHLPEEMSPSSAEIINTLNEHAIRLLQELHNKEETATKLGEALEEYKRKFAVIRHQQGLLYKEYQSEKELWEKELKQSCELQDKLQEQKAHDAIKIAEFNHWVNILQMDSEEIRRQVAEAARKMIVLKVNEKTLTRRYTIELEMEQHLRKENSKLKNEITAMESAVTKKIGYLQRYKDMAAFKIASLQKALDGSVPAVELERVNNQYSDLTIRYRDLLQKDNLLVQKAVSLEHSESENAVLRKHIDRLNKELEITKEKLHTLEQAWEEINSLGVDSMNKAANAITRGDLSVSKKMTMLEMKELNERQRADHAHEMYDCLRNTLKKVEERNCELENKFVNLTKQYLEAQKVEQELRDALAQSVSKAVSDADRTRILELEKTEAELKNEVSKLREVSDVAMMQIITLEARQQSRDKEIESLRKQHLDYQAESDESALIAKLHQHIVALKVSEAAAVSKLEVTVTKLQKLEAYNLRLEQKIDDKEQALYYARQEGRNRAKHLQQTVQSLRRQFSGALPLPQQEKFSKTMIQLQNDKVKIHMEKQRAEEERRKAEEKMLELELKFKGLEELISTLKDARGAQKVSEWHKRMEELRLQDLKQSRELGTHKEEIKYLKKVISDQERTICHLEEEIVQQNNFHEECQLSWEQREVELERQLDKYEQQHNEVLMTAKKFEEATGAVPDPSLPLTQQLEMALRKIKEHVRTIVETQATCKNLEENLKKKELDLWKAEQNIFSRDKVINELRILLPASAKRDKLIEELERKDGEPEYQVALKVAQQTIANLQARLNQKEDVIKKYLHMLTRSRQEQEDIAKKHSEELSLLLQKLNLQSDTSLHMLKQSAMELIKTRTISLPTSRNLARFAEMELILAEQENSLSVFAEKLKRTTAELDKQKQITFEKIKEHEKQKSKLEISHRNEVTKLKEAAAELRNLLSKVDKEMRYLKDELEAQKEINARTPPISFQSLVERLKSQLAVKEKQQKELSKALQQLRSEMTEIAEQQIIANEAQKKENLNIQQLVDKQTMRMKLCMDNLQEQLHTERENLQISKNEEITLKSQMEDINIELQKTQMCLRKVDAERTDLLRQNQELKEKIKKLSYNTQVQSDARRKLHALEQLQKKVRTLEAELASKGTSVHVVKKAVKEDPEPKEEVIRWEEGKKWQAKIEIMRNKLRSKEKQVECLKKQLCTTKDECSRLEKEKTGLQKKVHAREAAVFQVTDTCPTEHEKKTEELKERISELENEIINMKETCDLTRDSALEHLKIKSRFLENKMQALERQLEKENLPLATESGKAYHELQRENLKLCSENVELHFKLEQAKRDLPRIKDQAESLKIMCVHLKKEKNNLQRKTGNVAKSGRYDKSVPELEKTIALMKKVVEKLQKENEELKETLSRRKLITLENENEKLKSDFENLKLHMEKQLNAKNEPITKEMHKIINENEELCEELKRAEERAQKLTVENNVLEVKNEELKKKLGEINKGATCSDERKTCPPKKGGKSWNSTVVTRMYETKLKDLETIISRKNKNLKDLRQLLQDSTEREEKLEQRIAEMRKQVRI